MSIFTDEEKEILETGFECEGFEKSILDGNEIYVLISSKPELSEYLVNVINSYEKYLDNLRTLSNVLRGENIDTFHY